MVTAHSYQHTNLLSTQTSGVLNQEQLTSSSSYLSLSLSETWDSETKGTAHSTTRQSSMALCNGDSKVSAADSSRRFGTGLTVDFMLGPRLLV